MLAVSSSSSIFSLCLQLLFIAASAADPSPFGPSKGTEEQQQRRVTVSRVIAAVEMCGTIARLKVACGTPVIKQ